MIMRSNQESGDETAALVEKVRVLEQEVLLLKGALVQQAQAAQEADRLLQEALEGVRTQVHVVNETITKQNRTFGTMEKRMEGVRTDFSTGIAMAVLVFSVLFVISFFIR